MSPSNAAASSSKVQLLPSYVPSAVSPSYTHYPRDGEERLQYNPHATRVSSRPTGVFTKEVKGSQVAIIEQEEGAATPAFSRQSLVTGTVTLSKRNTVKSVTIKLAGCLKTSVTGREADGRHIKLLDQKTVLWDDVDTPSILPFSIPFPTSFTYMCKTHLLPPSHRMKFRNNGTLRTEAKYVLEVIIARKGLNPTQTMKIPVTYLPGTRAPPLITHQHLFPTVKICPEEWDQQILTLQPRAEIPADTMDLIFLTPSSRTFFFTDNIPFHIQLAGSSAQLSSIFFSASNVMQVSIVRQIHISLGAGATCDHQVLGEAKLRSVPPSYEHQDVETLDWEGGVQSSQNHNETEGFFAGNVSVKDFIVLEVRQRLSSIPWPFLPHRVSIPLRLTKHSRPYSFSSEDQRVWT